MRVNLKGTVFTKFMDARKSASVSPGKPMMMCVLIYEVGHASIKAVIAF
jgi:hypothetical protein